MDVNLRITARKAKGRTPMHYACRNGSFEAVHCLVQELGAEVNPEAKQGVTPFQLAVWQNHLPVCRWLVEECGVNPGQVNDFGCGAVHWLGIAPAHRADTENKEAGSALLPLARWLASRNEIDFTSCQQQGHSALHKAAWMGHLAFCRYLHTEHDLWDDQADDAGNYAADLADMAGPTSRYVDVARFLRQFCSQERAESCRILGLDVRQPLCEKRIRQAYKEKVRLVHPDKNQSDETNASFDELQKAYKHLLIKKGQGSQSNPAHSLKLMLEVSGNQGKDSGATISDECLQARLIAVLLEYGDKGLDLSNLKKKWKQVWPDMDFPYPALGEKRQISLSQWLRQFSSVELRTDEKGCLRAHALSCSRANIAAAVASTS